MAVSSFTSGLTQEICDNFSMDIGQPIVATLMLVGELFVIDAKLVENSCL